MSGEGKLGALSGQPRVGLGEGALWGVDGGSGEPRTGAQPEQRCSGGGPDPCGPRPWTAGTQPGRPAALPTPPPHRTARTTPPRTAPYRRRDLKKHEFSRRRKHRDDADVDYINDRNAHFNKKIERMVRGGPVLSVSWCVAALVLHCVWQGPAALWPGFGAYPYTPPFTPEP